MWTRCPRSLRSCHPVTIPLWLPSRVVGWTATNVGGSILPSSDLDRQPRRSARVARAAESRFASPRRVWCLTLYCGHEGKVTAHCMPCGQGWRYKKVSTGLIYDHPVASLTTNQAKSPLKPYQDFSHIISLNMASDPSRNADGTFKSGNNAGSTMAEEAPINKDPNAGMPASVDPSRNADGQYLYR